MVLEAILCALPTLDKECIDLWVVFVGLYLRNCLIYNGLQATYVEHLFSGFFCKKSNIAETQSEKYELRLGLLRQAELIALKMIASTRCARLVGLRVVALRRCVRLLGLRVVALHCGRSRSGYRPSLMTWSRAASLKSPLFLEASSDKHVAVGVTVVD